MKITHAADNLLSRALENQKSGKLSDAINQYKQYLSYNTYDLKVLIAYGVCLRKAGFYTEAIIVYKYVLHHLPECHSLWSNLGNVLKDVSELEKSLQAHKNSLSLNQSNPESIINCALALRESGQHQQALNLFYQAKFLRSEKKSPDIDWEIAITLLYLKRYQQAWPFYESRFKAKNISRIAPKAKKWQGEDLRKKTILVIEEQGYGDIILASRLFTKLKLYHCHIVFACRAELHRLLKKSKADQIISLDQAPHQPCDFYCNLMSLFGLLDINPKSPPKPTKLNIPLSSKEKFSFIRNNSLERGWGAEQSKEKSEDADKNKKLNVGIVWSGSLSFADNKKRALPIEFFYPLFEIPNLQLFSLQKGLKESDLYDSPLSPLINNLAPLIEDFADTAAAVSQLDLIVMTDSSVAHLAASMGKPVINLLQFMPYWIYGVEGQFTPWYPSMYLLRQSKPGDWSAVQIKMRKLVESFTFDGFKNNKN